MAARDFSTDSRDAMAARGVAMPDGSYPIPDKDALRRAIASYGRAKDPEAVKRHIIKRARALGATDMLPEGWAASKSSFEMKAEPMTTARLDKWLRGDISRRVLVLPFGGPIPSQKSSLGVDLDGEWFDGETDIFGPYSALRTSRERLVDWHHEQDPTGRMKGAILGHIVLDEEPEDDGYWADFWANAGEKRRALIAKLERGGVPLYGSSEAVYKKARDDGHIDEWPLIRHTITTSPQNTFAVVPPLKALLTMDDLPLEEVGIAAVKAALLGLGDLASELSTSFPDAAVAASALGGENEVKAGRVISARNYAQLRTFIDDLAKFVEALHGAPSDATTLTDSEGEPEQ